MVRPVVYSPKKAFEFSAEDQAKYKEIAASVVAKGKDGKLDAKAASEKVDAALALVAKEEADAWDSTIDDIDVNDKDFVGIVLDASGGAVSGGELEVNTDDVYVEEPRVVEDDEDADDAEERSLWGDGDDEPGETSED
mmetsp:Transcript_100803/g.225094  ORF Transcript_100803/g.225094 Transcript_100803/m.225094 type:complete len:138 (+) Transcript_100803:95-508(+)